MFRRERGLIFDVHARPDDQKAFRLAMMMISEYFAALLGGDYCR